MDAPQERHLVIGPVRRVLHQVRHQHRQEQLQRVGQAGDGLLQRLIRGPGEQPVHEEVDAQQHRADRQVVEQEVLHVHLPFRAEHGLAVIQREQLLEDDEDGAGGQQVQDEPVQAQVGMVAGVGGGHHDLAAAGGHGAAYQGEGGDVEPALAAENDIGQRDGARDQQRAEQQRAHRVHGIEGAQLGRGEIGREMKRQHAQHRQDRQEQRDHAADHAGAGTDVPVLPEQFPDLAIDGRALFHFIPMTTPRGCECIAGTASQCKQT